MSRRHTHSSANNLSQNPERIMALERLADVVRANVGRKAMRSSSPSPTTVRLDRIRDALSDVDAANGRWTDGTYGCTP